MKRLLVSTLAALFLVGSASAASAEPPPRPSPPVTPPGLVQSGVDRPEQACAPVTGRGNSVRGGSQNCA
jgi:hypothetical protein